MISVTNGGMRHKRLMRIRGHKPSLIMKYGVNLQTRDSWVVTLCSIIRGKHNQKLHKISSRLSRTLFKIKQALLRFLWAAGLVFANSWQNVDSCSKHTDRVTFLERLLRCLKMVQVNPKHFASIPANDIPRSTFSCPQNGFQGHQKSRVPIFNNIKDFKNSF